MLRRHCQSNSCPFAIVQRGHQLRMRYLEQKALTVHRAIVADDEHFRTRITRHLDSAPLSSVQVALRSRSCPQRARLEAVEPSHSSKRSLGAEPHRERIGAVPLRRALQAAQSRTWKAEQQNQDGRLKEAHG